MVILNLTQARQMQKQKISVILVLENPFRTSFWNKNMDIDFDMDMFKSAFVKNQRGKEKGKK